MCNNIDNNHLIEKCILRPKVALATVGTLLFGFVSCEHNQNSVGAGKSVGKYANLTPDTINNGISHLHDSAQPILGTVRGLKHDAHLGLIEFGPKMGLLFYAPKPLTDCVAIHLSNQKISLTYGDPTNPTILNNFIEVDGPLLKELLKKTEPLRSGNHSLKATCSKSFTTFHSTDYGICVKRGTKGRSVRLAAKDKVKAFTNIEHVGFVLTKSTTPSVNGLVKLIKYLLLERKSEPKIEICPAEIARNRLQPSKNPLGDAAYGYIKQGSRYRLMLLSPSISSVAQPKEVIVTITNNAKKAHPTADIATQTDSSFLVEDIISDDRDMGDSGFSDDQDHHASSMTSRTNSIASNIFDDESYKNSDHSDEIDDYTKHNDGDDQEEAYSSEPESNRGHSGYDSQDDEWDDSFDYGELSFNTDKKVDEWDRDSIVSSIDGINYNMFDDEPDEQEECNHDDKADDHKKDNDSNEQKEDYNDQLTLLNPKLISFSSKDYLTYFGSEEEEEEEFQKNSLDSSKEQPKSKTKTIND